MRHAILTALLWLAGTIGITSCAPSEPNELDKLGTVDITIKDQSFTLWIADNDDERAKGLMFVTSDQMADLPDGAKRGMIFVFQFARERSFWMKNTIIPLDIAYLDSDGKVVSTYTMAPLDTRSFQYPSRAPMRYAIEVNKDVYGQIGLTPGDVVDLPESIRQRAQ